MLYLSIGYTVESKPRQAQTSRSYFALISGTIVSRYGIRFNDGTNQLRNGQSANLTPQTLSANTPARGSYCMVATLDEYAPASCPSNADGYCLVDWVQFPNSAQFQ